MIFGMPQQAIRAGSRRRVLPRIAAIHPAGMSERNSRREEGSPIPAPNETEDSREGRSAHERRRSEVFARGVVRCWPSFKRGAEFTKDLLERERATALSSAESMCETRQSHAARIPA